jgi:hypothetical protein
VRTRAEIEAHANEAGFDIVSIDVDTLEVPTSFFMDFAAMAPRFMGRFVPQERTAVLDAARERLKAPTPSRIVRFVLKRRG